MPTVLVVEDDLDLRRMFRTALTFAGYKVVEAGDGLDALRLLDSETPDLVVLDLRLPLVSGLAVLQEIADAPAPTVPVVIVTGSPGAHDLHGATCVMRKPVTPERLVTTVRRCLESGSSVEGA